MITDAVTAYSMLEQAPIREGVEPAQSIREALVLARHVERLEEVDGRVRTLAQPREDPQVAAAPAVEHGGLLVVLHEGHRSRERVDAARRDRPPVTRRG